MARGSVSGLRIAVFTNRFEAGRTASSTADLVRTAKSRGHRVWVFHPDSISLAVGNSIHITGREVLTAPALILKDYVFGPLADLALTSCDVLVMRLQPPFDLNYFTACRQLAVIEQELLTMNRPSAIVDYPEKLYVMGFEGLHPPTLVSSDLQALAAFRDAHSDVIVKPLYDFQGAGVLRLEPSNENWEAVIELMLRLYRTPLVLQEYLPEIRGGDKRIFLLDGVPIGALNRVPRPGETRANLHTGGSPQGAELTTRDKEICAVVGPKLSACGLFFVGIDVIGGYVTEINTTSPTGIVPLRELSGIDVSRLVCEWWEATA